MYIAINQDFVKEEKASVDIKPWQIATQGCIFSECIRANAAKPLLLDRHFASIQANAQILKFNLPKYFDINFLSAQICGVLTRNKLFQAAIATVTFIRSLADNRTEIVITSEFAGDGPYEQNRQGLLIDIFDEAYVTTHRPSQLDQHCQLVNAIAKASAIDRHLNDMLLITEQGFVVSSTESDFFATRKGKLLTPPAELGSRHQVLSDIVIDLGRKLNYQVDCEALVMPEDLLTLDEVFLCSTAKGLQWVTGYKNHRFIHKDSKLLNDALNKLLIG